MTVLRSRLLKLKEDEEKAKYAAERRSQIGSGDRSERIRTYNFPQNRVTDHRIGFTLHGLPQVMEGGDRPADRRPAEGRTTRSGSPRSRAAPLSSRGPPPSRLKPPRIPKPAAKSPPMLTVLEVVRKTSEFFASKGIESPRLNAELLVGHALGLPRMQPVPAVRAAGQRGRARADPAARAPARPGASRSSTSSASRSSRPQAEDRPARPHPPPGNGVPRGDGRGPVRDPPGRILDLGTGMRGDSPGARREPTRGRRDRGRLERRGPLARRGERAATGLAERVALSSPTGSRPARRASRSTSSSPTRRT